MVIKIETVAETHFTNFKNEYEKLHSKVISLERELSILNADSGYNDSSFCNKIILYVESLYLSIKHSDIIFRTPYSHVPGHKFVFEARGAVWKCNMANDIEYIELRGISQKISEAFIRWIYKGTLNVTDDESLVSLMLLSKEYCLSSLLTQCETALIPLVNKQNCLVIYSSAFDSRATKLTKMCFTFISDIWSDINLSEINTLSSTILQSLLEKLTKFPIHLAIQLGRNDTVLSLIDATSMEVRLLVNQLDENGLSPLYLALSNGNIILSEKFLSLGADVDQLIGLSDSKQPLIHYAFQHMEYDSVKFLVSNGAKPDVYIPNTSQTIMHSISMIGQSKTYEKSLLELSNVLIENGVDLSLQDQFGNSSLHLCILYNSIGIFKILMNHVERLILNQENQQGLCPLWLGLVAQFSSSSLTDMDLYGFKYEFISSERYDYANQLVQVGADLNFRFEHLDFYNSVPLKCKLPCNGDTLMFSVVRTGRNLAALFLLEQTGCIPTLESSSVEGETILHVSIESGLIDLSKLLIKRYKIDPNRLRLAHNHTQICIQSKPIKAKLKQPISSNPFEDSDDYDDDDDDGLKEEFISQASSVEHLNTLSDNESTLTNLNYKCTPLHLAARYELFELISLYLPDDNQSNNVDWLLLDGLHESVFSLLLWSGQFSLVRQIFKIITYRGQQHDQGAVEHGDPMKYLNYYLHSIGKPSLLIQAIERNLLNVVEFLIECGANPNDISSYHNEYKEICDDNRCNQVNNLCPLWAAMNKHRWNIADYLISNGADVNLWSFFENFNVELNLLHRALHSQNEKSAIYLVEKNCLLNSCTRITANSVSKSTRDLDQTHLDFLMPHLAETPLHMGSSMGMGDFVRILIKSNRIDINQQDFDGQTPLHLAIRNKHQKVACDLLNATNIDFHVRNAQGHTVFQLALDLRQRTIAQLLLEKDPSLALQVDTMGRNFLHVAIENLDREALFFLIQIGADMNTEVRNVHRLTPLHLAIRVGLDEDLVRSLLLAGASINTQTIQKQSGLHLAAVYDRPNVISCLIENGANLNAQDSERNTPLHLAVRYAKIECMLKLLAHPSTNCYSTNIRGQLPIHLLAQHHGPICVEMFHHLKEMGQTNQINAQDAAGNTPLLLAYLAENILLCTALLHAGASLGRMNFEGDNVFSLNRKKFKTTSPKRVLSHILDSLTHEPEWEDGSNCIECGTTFGLTNRKHHCRHCGRLLCAQCSSFEMQIIKFDLANKPVRVCEVCFNSLNEPLGYCSN